VMKAKKQMFETGKGFDWATAGVQYVSCVVMQAAMCACVRAYVCVRAHVSVIVCACVCVRACVRER
jgi:hypothetical protein